MIVIPRQARDKRGKKLRQKEAFSLLQSEKGTEWVGRVRSADGKRVASITHDRLLLVS